MAQAKALAGSFVPRLLDSGSRAGAGLGPGAERELCDVIGRRQEVLGNVQAREEGQL